MWRCSWIAPLVALSILSFSYIGDANAGLRSSLHKCSAPGITDQYDDLFRKAAKRHLQVGYDWCWLKAWALAESNLKADAVSPAGAVGILQVMPATGKYIENRYGGKMADAYSKHGLKRAENNIRLASLYIAHLYRLWSYPREFYCHTQVVQASFNAGEGNILKAQELSGGRLCWSHISAFLHEVTGQKHSEETLSYVQRITENYLKLKGLI